MGLKHNLRWIKRELIAYFKDEDIRIVRYTVEQHLWWMEQEGERVARPNELGITLLTLWEYWIAQPYIIIRMGFCNHEYEGEGWGGPESGGDGGTCEKCGHSWSATFY